jgi:hypothetical protein
MKKEHRFTVVVKTWRSRKHAEIAVLCAFAGRAPDQCEFHLRKSAPKKKSTTAK